MRITPTTRDYAPATSSTRKTMDGENLAKELHKLHSDPMAMTYPIITFVFKHYGGCGQVYDAMARVDLEDMRHTWEKDL